LYGHGSPSEQTRLMWSPDIRRLSRRSFASEGPMPVDEDEADVATWNERDLDRFRAVLKAADVPKAHIEALVQTINMKRADDIPQPDACSNPDAVTVHLKLKPGSAGGRVRLHLWVYDMGVAGADATPAATRDVFVGPSGNRVVIEPDAKASRLVAWYYQGAYCVTVDDDSELTCSSVYELKLGDQAGMVMSDVY